MHCTFLNFTSTNNFNQNALFSTHNKGNMLDPVLADFNNISIPTRDPSFSIILFDITTKFEICRTTSTPNPVPFWIFSRANKAKIHLDCHSLEGDITYAITNKDSVDSVWSAIKLGVLNTAHSNIPNLRRKKKHNPWITKNTIKHIRRRKRWFKTKNKYPTKVNIARYEEQSKLCKRHINVDYNNYINTYICDKLDNGDSKPLYRYI